MNEDRLSRHNCKRIDARISHTKKADWPPVGSEAAFFYLAWRVISVGIANAFQGRVKYVWLLGLPGSSVFYFCSRTDGM
jgi:hypothetical protein